MKSSSKLNKESLKPHQKVKTWFISDKDIQKFKFSKEIKYIIGIDEVGRGPIAGPVTLCACVMDIEQYKNNYKKFSAVIQKSHGLDLKTVRDSKKMSEERREKTFVIFKNLQKQKVLHFILSSYSAKKIDEFGIAIVIRKAIKDILRNAQKDLKIKPENAYILLDGSLKAPEEFIFQKTIIKGDDIEKIISCASIFAKVTRDRYMRKIAAEARKNSQLDFGFDIHKGYGTKKHIEMVLGAYKNKLLSSEHRLTFIKKIISSL